jgi:hypothetical protein
MIVITGLAPVITPFFSGEPAGGYSRIKSVG